MRHKILIADDVSINREMLAVMLGDEHPVLEAENGVEAIKALEEHSADILVVLLDLVMPEKDGFAVLDYMHEHKLMDRIPVLVITVETSAETERKCLSLGVSDFIRKPFDNVVVKKRVNNIVELFTYKINLEERIALQTETLMRQNKRLVEQATKMRTNNEQIIDVLGTVVESRNLESGEHIKRVKGFTKIIAEEMAKSYPEYGLTEEKISVIVAASALHDIGKITIKDSVLLKPGRLTPEEFEYMKTHSIRGCEIVNQIENAWDPEYGHYSYEICRYHHERFDGKGYPDGLKGDEIPISAQLVSIADVYDALVSERVYKVAYSKEEAFNMIIGGKCGTFSPKIIDCFKKSRQAFEALCDMQKSDRQEVC